MLEILQQLSRNQSPTIPPTTTHPEIQGVAFATNSVRLGLVTTGAEVGEMEVSASLGADGTMCAAQCVVPGTHVAMTQSSRFSPTGEVSASMGR